MKLLPATTAMVALMVGTSPALAGVELSPFAGFRMGGSFDIQTAGAQTDGELRFKDTVSHGLVLNFDLQEAGKQGELYFGRQETSARLDNGLFAPGVHSTDVTIYQLQFGGLYFPGGQTVGGFVSGVAGVTRLEPKASDLKNHHRASLSLGGGYKWPVSDKLRLRMDVRGIYTALDSGGSVFCAGGCELRFRSSGYLQVEASAGLALRF